MCKWNKIRYSICCIMIVWWMHDAYAFENVANPSFTNYASSTSWSNTSRPSSQNNRQRFEEEERTLFFDIIKNIIVGIDNNTTSNNVCWVNGYGCVSMYTRFIDDAITQLPLTVEARYQNSLQRRLLNLKQSIQNMIQRDTLPFATYTLSVLSNEALESLSHGNRMPLLTPDQIRQLLPKDISNTNLEILLYEYAESFESQPSRDLTNAIKGFQQTQERWIQTLPQGYDTQALREKVRKVINVIARKDYTSQILNNLLAMLPVDERGYTIQSSSHDATLQDWTEFRKKIDQAERIYTKLNFGQDRQRDQIADVYKELYTLVYQMKDNTRECATRDKCIASIQRRMNYYLASLPSQHPFQRQASNFQANLKRYIQSQGPFDFAQALYKRMPKQWQDTFNTKKLPSIDRLSDQHIQEAIQKKRLSTGHIMVIMLQRATELSASERTMDYARSIAQFQSEMDKIITKFERVALKVNPKSAQEIENLRSLKTHVVQDAQKQSPRRMILDFLYDSIPPTMLTDFDKKNGVFLSKTDSRNFKDVGATARMPDAPPHGENPPTFTEQLAERPAARVYDTAVFAPGDNTKKKNETKKNKAKKSKKPKDQFKQISERVGSKAMGKLEGFLNKTLGKIFGGS